MGNPDEGPEDPEDGTGNVTPIGGAGDGNEDGEKGTEVEPAPGLKLGGNGQISLDVGGKTPTTSSINLVGGALPLEGELEKGEGVGLYVQTKVTGVSFIDKVDSKTGEVTETERKHTLKVVGVQRDNEAEAA